MKLNKIERACQTILSELKRGAFTRQELEFIVTFFTKIVEVTKKKLGEQK